MVARPQLRKEPIAGEVVVALDLEEELHHRRRRLEQRVGEELEAPAEVVAPRSKLGAQPAMKRLNAARRVLSDPVEAARHLQACQGGMTLRGAWEQEAVEELRQLPARLGER